MHIKQLLFLSLLFSCAAITFSNAKDYTHLSQLGNDSALHNQCKNTVIFTKKRTACNELESLLQRATERNVRDVFECLYYQSAKRGAMLVILSEHDDKTLLAEEEKIDELHKKLMLVGDKREEELKKRKQEQEERKKIRNRTTFPTKQ